MKGYNVNVNLGELLIQEWNEVSSEMLMRLIFAAQATMPHEPSLAVYDARLQLAEASMGLAANSHSLSQRYLALGQARTHMHRADQELEYHQPLITGQAADDIMQEAVTAILPICLTAVLDTGSMIRQNAEIMSAAIYEGALESIQTYSLDHGVKVGFWAYIVTQMKVSELTDRTAAEQSASTVATQQLQRTLRRAAAQIHGAKIADVGSTMFTYPIGKRPSDAWSDPRSMREKAQDWSREQRENAEKMAEIHARFTAGELSQEEADAELLKCGLDPEVAQALLEERMRGSRGLVRHMREYGVAGEVAAEVVITSANLVEQLAKNQDSDTLISGLDIGNDELVEAVLNRAASRGTTIPRELVESVVNFMLSGGGASLSLMNEEGDEVNHWVDQRAAEQAQEREETQKLNRVSRLLTDPSFANLIRQHPSMSVQLVNDRLKRMTSEEESTLQHFLLEQDIHHEQHPWHIRFGSGWSSLNAAKAHQPEPQDLLNGVVGQRHRRLGGLENMILPDHRMTNAPEGTHYGPKGIDSLDDLTLPDFISAVM